jgi:hypothetical protein
MTAAPARAGDVPVLRDGGGPGFHLVYEAGAPPAGNVGNGRSVVTVGPDSFAFVVGGDAIGRFPAHAGTPDTGGCTSDFFPGGVEYLWRGAPGDPAPVAVLHGALAATPYVLAFRWRADAPATASVRLSLAGTPPLHLVAGTRDLAASSSDSLVSLRPVLVDGVRVLVLCAGETPAEHGWAALRRQMEAPYHGGLQLHSGSPRLDRAVAFNQFLLDLGFDGHLHVCDLFRWRDIWSRDLGSGLVPGALRSGRFAAARTTLERDLERHRTWDPRGLRVSEDASKGGSAEGVSWCARAVEQDYLLTGDRELLVRATDVLRPWVESWIDRDADGSGLIVDVTEWMDHSRFFLFPDGARVLYSNVLYSDLLGRFARFEETLGHPEAASRLRGLRARSVRAINSVMWDDTLGAYANLVLGGRPDRRYSSDGNALAVLCGVAPHDRAQRAMASVREHNWSVTGSTSITPKMTHVPDYIDHNERVWPWWNAVEARARFSLGDDPAALHLLDRCAATLENPARPGLMKELLSPAGLNEGGVAFLSAAGSFQDAIVLGVLGFEVREPGCRRLRVSPHAAGWSAWSAVLPLPQGELRFEGRAGKLKLTVTDPRVSVIEAPAGAQVIGALWAPIGAAAGSGAASEPEAATTIPPTPRGAAVFAEPGIPTFDVPGFDPAHARRVDSEKLLTLDPREVQALIVPGNALPRLSRSGGDEREALARYLDGGGAIVFYGATMQDRGTMGEHGGVVDWYDLRPHLRLSPLGPWRFSSSGEAASVPRAQERGVREGWNTPGFDDAGWKPIRVPGWWEEHLGREYDGYGWYRTHFTLPAAAEGETLALDLGRIDDDDCTYVNGVFAGADKGWQTRRLYFIAPGSPAYAALRFGGDNVVAVQVADFGGGGGLHADSTRIGVVTRELAWQPLDAKTDVVAAQPIRHGVVSWGPGQRFFDAWEVRRGAFGFLVDARGVEFASDGPLSGVTAAGLGALPVSEAFTDFAVSSPWRFQPYAFTETHRDWLLPRRGERYPCLARLVNTRTGGEFLLVPRSLTDAGLGPAILERLLLSPLP